MFVYLLCPTKTFQLKKICKVNHDIVFKFWKKLEKNCRVFLTNRLVGSLHPPAKNGLFPLSIRKYFSVGILSSQKIFYTSHHYTTISMLKPNIKFILSQSHSCCTLKTNFIYFLYIQIKLLLILIDLQYVQNVILNFEKGSNGQKHSSSDSHNTTKKWTQQNFPLLQLERSHQP